MRRKTEYFPLQLTWRQCETLHFLLMGQSLNVNASASDVRTCNQITDKLLRNGYLDRGQTPHEKL